MKALVTGSTGFVGANLVEGLAAAGHEVRALHRPSSRMNALAGLEYEAVVGDVLDTSSLAAAMRGVDLVFHVAAVSDHWRHRGTARLYRVNVGGTRCVLMAAQDAGVRRVIFTSSAGSLGVPRSGTCASTNGEAVLPTLDESATYNLPPSRFPYGHSKHLAEKVVREYVARGLDVVILNPTAILGPRDINLIASSLILAVYQRQLPAIPPGGANYIDVADVVAGHMAAAERGRSGERYILGGHNLSHQQAITTIAEVVGVSPPPFHLPKIVMDPFAVAIDLFNRVWPGTPRVDGHVVRLAQYNLFYDSSKARRELKIGQPIPFRVSVERTFQWCRVNQFLLGPACVYSPSRAPRTGSGF